MRPILVAQAGFLAAALLAAAGGAVPSATSAATVTCPTAPLISEELARSPSVFVGTVRETVAQPDARGALLQVEEIWRGPALASPVRVIIDESAGAPAVELRVGIRYLVAADPVPGAQTAAGVVNELQLRPCSVTRPLTVELAGLRPSDARIVGQPTTPAPAGSRDESGSSPGWPWLLGMVILLASAGGWVLRRRGMSIPAWPAPAAAAVGIALLIGGAVMDGNSEPPDQAGIGTRSTSPSASVAASEAPAAPQDARLVVRLEVQAHWGVGAVASVHADGRLISTADVGGDQVFRVQLLTTEGTSLIRDAVAGTGLLGPDAPTQAEYMPQPRPGVAVGARGGFSETITAGGDGWTSTVTWAPISESEAHLFEPSLEIERLEALAQLLLAPGSVLPSTAWADAEPRPYQATGFRLTAVGLPFGAARPAIAIEQLTWPLSIALDAIEPTRDPAGRPLRCAHFSRGQAAELLSSIGRAQGVEGLTLSARRDVDVDDRTAMTSHHLSLVPLLPDEAACSQPPSDRPAAELAPGAVALVRVDRLRVRAGPGSEFEAIDAFGAGERVAIVEGPLPAAGMDWYRVRQGPGERGGWVATGPADDAPWLVPIGDGAIAFMRDPGSLDRMEPDGSGLATLAEGGGPVAWSPDGRRFAFAAWDEATGASHISVANADGSGRVLLAIGEYPSWAPDGSAIAFTRWEDDGLWLLLMRSDGSDERRLTNCDCWLHAWSPDGRLIAFVRSAPVVQGGEGIVPIPEALWIVDVATGAETRLTPDELLGRNSQPSWSPDGTLLTYENRLLKSDGSVVMILEPSVSWSDAPWSPDGEGLLLVTESAVQLLTVDDGERRTVVQEAGGQVTWSPSGRQLAYVTVVGDYDDWRVQVVDLLGGEAVQIGPPLSQHPAWQPLVSHAID